MSKTDTLTTRNGGSLGADVPSAPPETHQEADIALRAGSDEANLRREKFLEHHTARGACSWRRCV
jgi:hypothetical protein